MSIGHRRGFTLLEVMISIAVFSIFAVLLLTPLVNSLNVVSRESSLLAMDQSADRALNGIASELQKAVLPVATYNAPPANLQNFQDLLNHKIGFRANGRTWREVLAAGTDFIPFCVPADFGGDGDRLDANLVVELGIVLPDDTEIPAGNYVIDADDKNTLRDADGALNPDLADLVPGSFGADVTKTPSASNVVITAPRFAQPYVFPANARGYGIIRFVPFLDPKTNNPVTVSEATVGQDLNGDNDRTDSFVLGHIEINYAPGGAPASLGTNIFRIISGPMVLLQTNRSDPAWTPIFQLVRYDGSDAGTASSPNSNNYNSSTNQDGKYAILVRLLLWDNLAQTGNPLAFGRNKFLTREYQTLIKLRNMSLRSDVEAK